MKKIEFKDPTTNRIYSDYIKRIQRMITVLSKADQEDILMEFNSHIYESVQHNTEHSEVESLMKVLDRLGAPEVVLIPMVADKKLTQATKTFNPLHVFKALVLNITNGISYVIFSLFYLFLFCFVFLIFAKIIYPQNTGFFIGVRGFRGFGLLLNDTVVQNSDEILGNWFIPLMVLATVVFYMLITLGLKLKRKFIK